MTVIEEAEERLRDAVNAARYLCMTGPNAGKLTGYQWPLHYRLEEEVLDAALNLVVQKELAAKVADVCLKKG